jgi:integrase
MTGKKTPSHTIKVKVQGVREFFYHHNITLDELGRRKIKKVMPRKMHRETNFDYMTVEKIQAILPHCDIRMQTLILCLLSSGARIGEMLSATIPDLDLDAKPISLRIRETKSGEPRTVFFTEEAGESLKKWLKSRDGYLETAGERSAVLKINKKVKDNKRIFPFEKPTVYRAYNRALTKAGLFTKDDRTDRNVLNIHRLRGFFKVTVNPIVGIDTAELLLGHVDQYGNAYRDLDDKSIRKQYLRCEQELTISNNVRIKRDLELQSAELQTQKTELDSLQRENADMKKELSGLREMLAIQEGGTASLQVTIPNGLPADKVLLLNRAITNLNRTLSDLTV